MKPEIDINKHKNIFKNKQIHVLFTGTSLQFQLEKIKNNINENDIYISTNILPFDIISYINYYFVQDFNNKKIIDICKKINNENPNCIIITIQKRFQSCKKTNSQIIQENKIKNIYFLNKKHLKNYSIRDISCYIFNFILLMQPKIFYTYGLDIYTINNKYYWHEKIKEKKLNIKFIHNKAIRPYKNPQEKYNNKIKFYKDINVLFKNNNIKWINRNIFKNIKSIFTEKYYDNIEIIINEEKYDTNNC